MFFLYILCFDSTPDINIQLNRNRMYVIVALTLVHWNLPCAEQSERICLRLKQYVSLFVLFYHSAVLEACGELQEIGLDKWVERRGYSELRHLFVNLKNVFCVCNPTISLKIYILKYQGNIFCNIKRVILCFLSKTYFFYFIFFICFFFVTFYI